MTGGLVAEFKQRMAKLRQLRERTGAPMSACDKALKACGGDVEAAAAHPEIRAARGVDWAGYPRHYCRDDCPPWPFAPRGYDKRGHVCDTHCPRHPDPRTHSLALVRQLVDLDDSIIEGALRICGWDVARTVRFLREAGARCV